MFVSEDIMDTRSAVFTPSLISTLVGVFPVREGTMLPNRRTPVCFINEGDDTSRVCESPKAHSGIVKFMSLFSAELPPRNLSPTVPYKLVYKVDAVQARVWDLKL